MRLEFALLQNYVKPWQLYRCEKLLHETVCSTLLRGRKSFPLVSFTSGWEAFCILIQCVDRRLLL